MSERNNPCYVAYCACGNMVCASVDTPDRTKDNAKHLAAWVRDGLRVGHVASSAIVRAELKRCACPDKSLCTPAARQEALAL